MCSLLRSYNRQVLKLIDLFLARPKPQGYLPSAFAVLDLKAHCSPRAHPRKFVVQECISRGTVDGGNAVASGNACTLCFAVGFHANYFRLTAEVCGCRETGRGDLHCLRD